MWIGYRDGVSSGGSEGTLLCIRQRFGSVTQSIKHSLPSLGFLLPEDSGRKRDIEGDSKHPGAIRIVHRQDTRDREVQFRKPEAHSLLPSRFLDRPIEVRASVVPGRLAPLTSRALQKALGAILNIIDEIVFHPLPEHRRHALGLLT